MWAVVGIAVVRMALGVVRRWVSGQVSLAVEYDLRARLFAHLQRMSFAYFDRMPVGQLMSRATSDLQTVRFFLGYGLIFVFMQAFTLIIIAAILLVMNWSLALLALAMGPALLAVTWRYSRRSNPVLIDVQQKVGEVTEMAEESAVGIRVIKAFGREGDQSDRFGATARRAFDRSMDAAHIRALYQPLMGFLPVVGLGVVLIYGGFQVIDGALTLGEFVAFYLYLTMLMVPFRSLGLLVAQSQRAIAGGTRIFEVLDAAPDVADAPGARPVPAGDGAIRLLDVTFAYDPDGPPVLDGVDLDIPAGRSVALIGPTGSGKSTLTQLIPRYYDATAGRVLVDGADVRDVRLDELRRQIGVVSQDPFLFSTSVRENIAYGRPEATDEEIRARGADGPGRGVHRRAAGGLRHRDRRARLHALGRPAPAGGDRPRPDHRPAHPDPRRGDGVGRRLHRARDPGGPRARSWRGARRWSSPTACPPSPWPTSSWCWRRAGSSPAAPTTSSTRRAGSTATSTTAGSPAPTCWRARHDDPRRRGPRARPPRRGRADPAPQAAAPAALLPPLPGPRGWSRRC